MRPLDIPENRIIEVLEFSFAKGNITRTIKNYNEVVNNPLYFGLSENEVYAQKSEQAKRSINGQKYEYELQNVIDDLLLNSNWVKIITVVEDKIYVQLSKTMKDSKKLHNIKFFNSRKDVEIIFQRLQKSTETESLSESAMNRT